MPRKTAAKAAFMPPDCLLTRTSQVDLKIGWWGKFVLGIYRYFWGNLVPSADELMSGNLVVAGVREVRNSTFEEASEDTHTLLLYIQTQGETNTY